MQITYDVRLTGLEGEVETAAKSGARLFQRRDRPMFSTSAGLRRQLERDAERVRSTLVSLGYYAATVETEIRREDDRYVAQLAAQPGRAFTITRHEIVYSDEQKDARPLSPADLDFETGDAADGESIEAVENRILAALRNKGWPEAAPVGRRAVADFDAGSARAIYTIRSGPFMRYGDLELSGAERVKTTFLAKYADWRTGEAFDLSEVSAFQSDLSGTGLFQYVRARPGDPGDDGFAPIIVDVRERKRRTIGAGLSFDTDIGPGGRLFFEHRNMFGAAERSRADLDVSPIRRELRFNLDKPFPKVPGSFLFETGVIEETTDAFDAQRFDISAGFAQRYLADRLTVGYGVGFEAANIDEDDTNEKTGLLSFPLSASWRHEDDPLDPRRGERASLSVTPFTGAETFVAVETRGATRVAYGREQRFVSALRVRYGLIFGPEAADIPAPRRYYAGGGGSVRGYGFQKVGPLNDQDEPLGGRSVAEAAFEQRARVRGPVELAAFVDGGLVSDSATPEEGDQWLYGAGGGVRIATPVGPVRLDVATPIIRRPTDDAFEIYISIGQPF